MSHAHRDESIVLASNNAGKVREINELLSAEHIRVIPQGELGVSEADETGLSFVENALLKAREYAELSGLLTLADDSGLEVDALNGRPGVHSARYAPDSPARIQKLLGEMQNIPADQRSARFQCVIALAWPDGRKEITTGTCEGWIADEARGSNGFGFDPVFHVAERGINHECINCGVLRAWQ